MAQDKKSAPPLGRPSGRNYLLFGMVGLVALALGIWQIKTSLTLPLSLGEEASGTPEAGSNLTPAVSDDELRRRDTDQDGLSDYDEQYLYKTSAYLKDTDSDGFNDKTEVTSGNDPLCPSGQNCNTPAPAGTPPAAEVAPPNLSAAEIRALLKRNGASDQELAQYNDAQLVAIYQELAGSTSTPSGSIGTNSNQLTPEQRETLSKLKGDELRQFLIKGGADANELGKLDNATLEAIVKEMLSSQ